MRYPKLKLEEQDLERMEAQAGYTGAPLSDDYDYIQGLHESVHALVEEVRNLRGRLQLAVRMAKALEQESRR